MQPITPARPPSTTPTSQRSPWSRFRAKKSGSRRTQMVSPAWMGQADARASSPALSADVAGRGMGSFMPPTSTPRVKPWSSRSPGLDPVLMGQSDTWCMDTADAVVRRRGLVLVCWVVALGVLAPHAVGVERVLETAARVDGSESARVEAELASRFRAPFAHYALLVVRGGASPVTPAGRELTDSVVGAVAVVAGVAAVRGYRDARDTLLLGRDSSGTFVLVGLDPAAGRPDAIVPRLRAATAALAQRLVARFPELELRWTGETVLNADLRQASRASARLAERRALPLT